MLDIITFGSATLDVFVSYKKIGLFKKEKKKGVFLPLGEKLEGEKILFRSGGGGANTAATFVNQGLKVAFCGMVGKDFAGKFVLEDLKKFKVKTDFVFKTGKKPTNCSVIFSGQKGKSILPYRGASSVFGMKDIPLKKLKARWFYFAPLSGKLKEDFLKLIEFARKRNIKVALNPSKYQLVMPEIKKALKKIDVLILNQEEASFLTKVSFEKEKEVFQKLDELVKGICIMTKGEKGVTVSDGKFLYTAPVLKTKVIDETGAGDSFGSGFVAEYIKTKDVVSAIQLATANSVANLKEVGAKEGILEKGQKYKKVKVKKELLN